MNAPGKPQRFEKTADMPLLNKIVVPETQDMPCHDSASLWASPKIFEPRFLSDSVCMHPGVGRLSTISNFRFSFLSGIVQFHILSALGYIHIGGGWNNPHTIQPFLSWLISQPTQPPPRYLSRNKAWLRNLIEPLVSPWRRPAMKPPGFQKTSKVLLLSQVDPSFGASTWPNTRLKTFRMLEDTCIEI